MVRIIYVCCHKKSLYTDIVKNDIFAVFITNCSKVTRLLDALWLIWLLLMNWLLFMDWLLVFDFWWLTDCWVLWYLCPRVQKSAPQIQKLVADVWYLSWLKLTAGNRLCWYPLSENFCSCSMTKWHWVVACLAIIDSRILWWCGMVHVCSLEIRLTA